MTESPKLNRRELNKLEKRKRISVAARQLFHAQGFAETSTAQIARAAGVAEGTLFLYVSRKEDLLILAFLDELEEAVSRSFQNLDAGAPFVDQVVAYFTGILAYHDADRAIAKLFLREVGVLNDPARDYGFGRIPMMPCLETIARRALAQGTLDPAIDTGRVARLCFAIYWGALREWINDAIDTAGCAAEIRVQLEMAVRGLARSA